MHSSFVRDDGTSGPEDRDGDVAARTALLDALRAAVDAHQ